MIARTQRLADWHFLRHLGRDLDHVLAICNFAMNKTFAPPRPPLLSDDAPPSRKRFSEILKDLGERDQDRVYVDDILKAFGDRAFGALMLFFAAPNMIPLPPGSSAILGLPLLFITAQLMMGRSVLWMPRVIARRSLTQVAFRNIVSRLLPWLYKVERILKPRLPQLVGDISGRAIGAASFVLAVVLFLPIPLGNMLPGLAVSLFALGLVERDGVAVIFGWITAFASVAALALVSAALLAAATAFVDYFRSYF